MNAAYLSDLFSRAVGVPFKAYLTELRLTKARELLGDPAQTAAEVAYSSLLQRGAVSVRIQEGDRPFAEAVARDDAGVSI